MSPILEWGIPIIQWMQSLGLWLEPVMQFFTFLGTENFYLLILPIFIWWIDIGLGIRIGLGLLISALINAILKINFGLPRPYWVSEDIRAFSSESSFGLPSGHAQNAIVLWGLIAAWSEKWWFRTLMIVLIGMIAISRTYLGVHFPADTIVGLLAGAIILWGFIRLEDPIKEWLGRLTLGKQLLFAAAVVLLLLIIGLGSINIHSARPLPSIWTTQAAQAIAGAEPIDPYSSDSVIANSATLLGISWGAILLINWNAFDPAGSWLQRISRYVVGLAGLLLIFFGLRSIFPTQPALLGAVLRFTRYALVGFWVAYLAPRLFVKMRIA